MRHQLFKSIMGGFLLFIILPVAVSARGSNSTSNSTATHKHQDSILMKIILKGMDVAKDLIFDWIDRYFSFTSQKPPDNEDPEIKKLREQIEKDQKIIHDIARRNESDKNEREATKILRDSLKSIGKLDKKMNNSRVHKWKKIIQKQVESVELDHSLRKILLDDFLQDLIEIENEKPRTPEEAERRQRVEKIKNNIVSIHSALKNFENNTDVDTKTVREQVKDVMQEFQKLAKEMNRDGLLKHYAFKQLKHRAEQESMDLKSIAYDINYVLDMFNSDPDADALIVLSTSLKLLNLYLNPFLYLALYGTETKKNKRGRENSILHYVKLMIPVAFEELERNIPDNERFANFRETVVKTNQDIFKPISDINFYTKKIKEFYNEIYWNNENRLNKAEKQRKKQEDKNSGREDYNNLRINFRKLVHLIYNDSAKKDVATKGRKIVDEAIVSIKNLGRKLDENPMKIFAQRLESIEKGTLNAKQLSRALGIVAEADEQMTDLAREDPIDLFVVGLKRRSHNIPILTVCVHFLPIIAHNLARAVVKPITELAWKLVDSHTTKGYDDFEEEVEDIQIRLQDHEHDTRKFEEDLWSLRKTIDKFIERNKGLM